MDDGKHNYAAFSGLHSEMKEAFISLKMSDSLMCPHDDSHGCNILSIKMLKK